MNKRPFYSDEEVEKIKKKIAKRAKDRFYKQLAEDVAAGGTELDRMRPLVGLGGDAR